MRIDKGTRGVGEQDKNLTDLDHVIHVAKKTTFSFPTFILHDRFLRDLMSRPCFRDFAIDKRTAVNASSTIGLVRTGRCDGLQSHDTTLALVGARI